MQGIFYMNGEKVQVIDELPEIQLAENIGVDLANGKDKTVIVGRGRVTGKSFKIRADWMLFKMILEIERERQIKNIAAFMATWKKKRERVNNGF